MAWFIKTHWNKSRLHDNPIPLDRIADLASAYLHRFHLNQPTNQKLRTSKGKKKWSPPPLDSFKTNFDGTVFESSNEVKIGVMIRNSNSEIIAALSEKIPLPPSVVILESLAGRRVSLICSWSRYSIILWRWFGDHYDFEKWGQSFFFFWSFN